MICLDTIGYFSDAPGSQHYPPPFGAILPNRANFIAFVGMPGSRAPAARSHGLVPAARAVSVDWRHRARFHSRYRLVRPLVVRAAGFPAMMITDTAIFRYPHYHRPTDTPDKVNYERLARITKGIERVLRDMVK